MVLTESRFPISGLPGSGFLHTPDSRNVENLLDAKWSRSLPNPQPWSFHDFVCREFLRVYPLTASSHKSVATHPSLMDSPNDVKTSHIGDLECSILYSSKPPAPDVISATCSLMMDGSDDVTTLENSFLHSQDSQKPMSRNFLSSEKWAQIDSSEHL